MASPTVENSISLKALVDKGSNKVFFIESDYAFIDVLLSFLTIPLGTIIKLGRKHTIPVEIGCMNSLYSSVEKIDEDAFLSDACRNMLLLPRNVAESHCKNLQLQIDHNAKQPVYFLCNNFYCRRDSTRKFFSYYKGRTCPLCSSFLSLKMTVSVNGSQVGSVFVNERARLLITDDLQMISPFSASSPCLFTKLGVSDRNTTEELTLNIGDDEVFNLLMSSLASKTPLTETLLKHKPVPNLSNENINRAIYIDPEIVGDTLLKEEDTISIKLIVSKYKKMVCYTEAGEDFVNLLFSFLTLPLMSVAKQMRDGSLKGCIDQLYWSVQDLDGQYLKSNHHKEMLLNPKPVPRFCYNSLLGLEEASYYYLGGQITTERLSNSNKLESVDLDSSAQGFLKGPANFTVTDSLVIRPISTIFELSVLDELKVPLTDIEDKVVHMGKKEALSLLVASFVCDSALTNAFMRDPNQE